MEEAVVALIFVAFPFIIRAIKVIETDFKELKYPKPYIDLETKSLKREVRPTDDVLFHLVLFKYKFLGDGNLLQRYLLRLNRKFLEWDIPFAKSNLAAKSVVMNFCSTWGVPINERQWEWSKPMQDYISMNDFFSRRYKSELEPETLCKAFQEGRYIVSPVTATVSIFSSVEKMPKLIKNNDFSIENIGLPLVCVDKYKPNLGLLFYLAPSDYHCFHAPISGKIIFSSARNKDLFSVTVKNYILSSVNILERNRSVTLIIFNEELDLEVCMVVIGGVTVDSIRFEDNKPPEIGRYVNRGEYLGCFARGGSSVAMFTSKPVELVAEILASVIHGIDFRIRCGSKLLLTCSN